MKTPDEVARSATMAETLRERAAEIRAGAQWVDSATLMEEAAKAIEARDREGALLSNTITEMMVHANAERPVKRCPTCGQWWATHDHQDRIYACPAGHIWRRMG